MSEAARLRDVEIFASGTHRDKAYTGADLEQIVRNFNTFSSPSATKVMLHVPSVIGHDETQEYLARTDLPAAGWVESLRTDGEKLYADIGGIPAEVARLLIGKAYRTVSAEIYDTPPPGIKAEGKMLRRVAFLGGDIPEVKGLAEIPTPEGYSESFAPGDKSRVIYRSRMQVPGASGVWACFSEVVRMSDRSKKPGPYSSHDRSREGYGRRLFPNAARRTQAALDSADASGRIASPFEDFMPSLTSDGSHVMGDEEQMAEPRRRKILDPKPARRTDGNDLVNFMPSDYRDTEDMDESENPGPGHEINRRRGGLGSQRATVLPPPAQAALDSVDANGRIYDDTVTYDDFAPSDRTTGEDEEMAEPRLPNRDDVVNIDGPRSAATGRARRGAVGGVGRSFKSTGEVEAHIANVNMAGAGNRFEPIDVNNLKDDSGRSYGGKPEKPDPTLDFMPEDFEGDDEEMAEPRHPRRGGRVTIERPSGRRIDGTVYDSTQSAVRYVQPDDNTPLQAAHLEQLKDESGQSYGTHDEYGAVDPEWDLPDIEDDTPGVPDTMFRPNDGRGQGNRGRGYNANRSRRGAGSNLALNMPSAGADEFAREFDNQDANGQLYNEGTPMREQMLKKLAEHGMDTSCVTPETPDAMLAEMGRLLDDQGGGDSGMGSATGGQGMRMHPLDQQEDEWADPEDDDEKMMFAENARKYMERARAYARKYGEVEDEEAREKYEKDEKEQAKKAENGTMKMSEFSRLVRREVAAAMQGEAAGAVGQLKKFHEENLATEKTRSVDAVIERVSAAGKLPAAIREQARKRLLRADSRVVVEKFSEKGRTVELTEFDLQVRELERAPSMFGERMSAGGSQHSESEDAETAKIESHFEMFSENFSRMNVTAQTLVAAYKQARKTDKGLTATQFLNR